MNLPVIGLAGEVLMNEAILIQKYYFLMLKMQSHTPSLRIEQTYALAVGIDHRLWLQLQLLARKWDCHLRVAFLFKSSERTEDYRYCSEKTRSIGVVLLGKWKKRMRYTYLSPTSAWIYLFFFNAEGSQ